MSDYEGLNIQINNLLERSRELTNAGWYEQGRDAALVAAVHIVFAQVSATTRAIEPIEKETKNAER